MTWIPALLVLTSLACFSSDKGDDDDDDDDGGGGGGWDLGLDDSGTTGEDGGDADGGSGDGGSSSGDGGSSSGDGGSSSGDGGSSSGDGGSSSGDGGSSSGDGGSSDRAGSWRGPVRIELRSGSSVLDSCEAALNLVTNAEGNGASSWVECPFGAVASHWEHELMLEVSLRDGGQVEGLLTDSIMGDMMEFEFLGTWDDSAIQGEVFLDAGEVDYVAQIELLAR